MSVFVLDQHGHPIMPCSEKRARQMLERGRARVHRVMPFTIRLVDRLVEGSALQPLQVKIDPGSKTTGIALVRKDGNAAHAVTLLELEHRADHISKLLYRRRLLRHARRARHGRYRNPRRHYSHRLAPSIRHRLLTTETWVRRLMAWAPVSGLAFEQVAFGLRAGQRDHEPGLSLRERLMSAWGGRCAYCGGPGPFQIDHVRAKAKHGGDHIGNRVLACVSCNKAKGALRLSEFVSGDRREDIKSTLTPARRDEAAVNIARNALGEMLAATGLPVEATNTRHTKMNRRRLGLHKGDALDALVLGQDLGVVTGAGQPVLHIQAMGRGSHQRTRVDAAGFPTSYLMRTKRVHGFATGDLVRARVGRGEMAGVHVGRVAVRANGNFNVVADAGVLRVSWKFCDLLQKGDGYRYGW